MSFSCCGDETFLSRLKNMQRRQVIVTGMETHICVLQTALELLAQGYYVHVVSDAVISRKKRNWELGLNMAASAGAVITSTEAAMFQLLKVAGTDEFKKLSKLVR
jgi:nicotinamidase-related amidase